MRQLYLRVWLTVVAVLALFAVASGWLFQRHLEQERERHGFGGAERIHAMAELVSRALPHEEAPGEQLQDELTQWSQRLRWPMALDDMQGRRLAESPSFVRLGAEGGMGLPHDRLLRLELADGRVLWLLRPLRGLQPGADRPPQGLPPVAADRRAAEVPREGVLGRGFMTAAAAPLLPFVPPAWAPGTSFLVVSVLLFAAVALGTYPVVRRLTRRLEHLQRGVEQFGSGQLRQRVDESGSDEVAQLAASFNRTADRIEALLKASQTLLANASHELRSPLARLKMAMAMLETRPEGPARQALQQEIDTNLAELDALIEEVLLASRLQAGAALPGGPQPDAERVNLLTLAAEASARHGAQLETLPEATPSGCTVPGDERLLRRALRNLLENARRYGGDEVLVSLQPHPSAAVAAQAHSSTPASWVLRVCDRGPGVPEALREQIFEPFYRLPGHAEREGGVGLGLALVRQIAQRHGGRAWCEPREGGGSCFCLQLPA